jgi:hypothetical protein
MSDGLEIACCSEQSLRCTFALDTCDRKVMYCHQRRDLLRDDPRSDVRKASIGVLRTTSCLARSNGTQITAAVSVLHDGPIAAAERAGRILKRSSVGMFTIMTVRLHYRFSRNFHDVSRTTMKHPPRPGDRSQPVSLSAASISLKESELPDRDTHKPTEISCQ